MRLALHEPARAADVYVLVARAWGEHQRSFEPLALDEWTPLRPRSENPGRFIRYFRLETPGRRRLTKINAELRRELVTQGRVGFQLVLPPRNAPGTIQVGRDSLGSLPTTKILASLDPKQTLQLVDLAFAQFRSQAREAVGMLVGFDGRGPLELRVRAA